MGMLNAVNTSPLSFASFIVALVPSEHILSNTVSLTETITESKVPMACLQGERDNEMVWGALYSTATEMANEFEIVPGIPRRAGRQQNDPSDYRRMSECLPFLDHLLRQATASE